MEAVTERRLRRSNRQRMACRLGAPARYLRWEWIATTCYHDSSNCENFLLPGFTGPQNNCIEEQILRRDLTWATMETAGQVAGLSADD